MILIRLNNNRGNAFLTFLFFLAMIITAGYFVYTNNDFQRNHKKEIIKFKLYIRALNKYAQDFNKDIDDKIAQWKKSHPSDNRLHLKPDLRTFEELLYDQQTLNQEIPAEMVRHQPDEITICSFNANFLINSPLTDKEMVHLANIFRFCDLSSIVGLQSQQFLPRITPLLKTLHYNASYETSSTATSNSKIFSAFLYRNDRIQILKPGRIYCEANTFSVPPYYGAFKMNNFDFIVATFNTPSSASANDSIETLENFYETVQNENQAIQDIMIFGVFAFRSEALSWDSASLLPTFAFATSADKTRCDLLGNFWFKKNDLIEFNGKSGIINIKEDQFPSKQKPSTTINKPIWTQFKTMADDD